MSAPNLLRVGGPEKVFVEAQDYTGGNLEVKISVMKHPKKDRELTSTSVTLTKDNNYMLLADITVCHQISSHLLTAPHGTSSSLFLSTPPLLSFTSFFLFICPSFSLLFPCFISIIYFVFCL